MKYLKYRCPQCNKVLQVKPSHTEINVKCDECKTEFTPLPDANILNRFSLIKKPIVILILFAIAITTFIFGILLPRSIKPFFEVTLFLLSMIIAIISEFIIRNIRIKTMGQVISIVIFCTMVLLLLVYGLVEYKEIENRIFCKGNMYELSSGIWLYAQDHNEYPTADNWCDLLIEGEYARERLFKCRGGKKGRCSYAINPNAEPSSPNDVVLIFETKGGWNQFGGLESLSTNNHQGRGAFITFNDIRTQFIKPEQFGELKWGDGEYLALTPK